MFEQPSRTRREEHHLLAQRLDDLVRAAPITSLAAMFAALAMAIVLLRPDNRLPGTVWLALVVTANLARLFVPLALDAGQSEALRARQLWRRLAWCGHANSALFALGLPLLLRGAGGLEIAFAFLVTGGLLGATLVNAKASPAMARWFVALVTLGGSLAALLVGGRLGVPMMIVLLAQAAILTRVIAAQEALFRDRSETDFARREADATVRLLLGDYEEHSSDWLWTTDAEGRLAAVSERLAAVSGREAEAMEGLPLTELFSTGPERERLQAALAQKESFRDLVLPLELHGQPRAWALSARPLEDGRIKGFARDVTEAQRAEEKVAKMAHFDALTGLANRNLFQRTLRQWLKGPEASRGVALFYLDLDDFKSVNDTQGHGTGDKLLKALAERLSSHVRASDLVARLGGDEFAVILRGEASDRALAERAGELAAFLAEPVLAAGQEFLVSASIGIARRPVEGCDAEELMRRADLALYAAKARGRGSHALFDTALDEAARDRRMIETELRGALRRGELEVHYQSIVDLNTGRVSGHEALLRWQHPKLGTIMPSRFIPIAEASGLIVPIGEWVIAEALREVATWGGSTRLAINLSPVQLRSPNLVPAVTRALAESGIAPQRLELEITEGALMRNSEANRAVLLKLRELGLRIALDDFGTGYSSLGYLRSFPFDRIKIDRCFVEDVVEQADSQAIIAAVTRLAAALGMRTTAEGVEQIEQLDMLRKLGCNDAQGFLIARPMSADELPAEEAQLALPAPLPAEIIDYRKARLEAQRRAKEGRARTGKDEARRA